MISLEDDMAQSLEQALIFGAFLERLSAPTSAQTWLREANEKLRAERINGSGRAVHQTPPEQSGEKA